jgi:16S rRNA (uracil1498-N3)-methyltransferase
MLRLFIEKTSEIQSNKLNLKPETYHYLKNVLRLQTNSELALVIKKKTLLTISVESIENNILSFKIINEEKLLNFSLPHITVAQCLPKQSKFSDILRKCTEIGVSTFIPIISDRVISRPDTKKKQSKHQRWQKVIENAASQSKQIDIPKLLPIKTFAEFLDISKNYPANQKLVFWEEEKTLHLKYFLQTIPTDPPPSFLILIGPEGGLSSEETTKLQTFGFNSVTLGPTILRVENAALVASANILYELT